jgi:hypothetical protein
MNRQHRNIGNIGNIGDTVQRAHPRMALILLTLAATGSSRYATKTKKLS